MKTPKSKFTPVNDEMLEQIRLWRNMPRIRNNMLDDTIISPEKQQLWLKAIQNNTDNEYKVFYQNEKPIGMLYFTSINKKKCEWGCYLGEQAVWPGSGVILEIAALDYAFTILDMDNLYAEVFEENQSPIRMHHFFDYQIEKEKTCNTRSGRKITLKCFSYSKKNWKTRREGILMKLPKQMYEAASFIEFT